MRSYRQTSCHGNIAHPVLLPAGEDGYFIRLDAVRNRLVCLERQLRIPHLRPFAQTAEGIQRTEAITIVRPSISGIDWNCTRHEPDKGRSSQTTRQRKICLGWFFSVSNYVWKL